MRYLTTGQVAKAFEVSVAGVKKWVRQGKLHAIRTPGGHLRVPVEEFERFQTAHGFAGATEESPRILVVDDDPPFVGFVLDLLRAIAPDWKVEAAADGYEGLLKIGTFLPHLVLLDLRMRGLDGLEVCRRVKQNPITRATKILVVTGYADDTTKSQASSAGADAFLGKPVSVNTLATQIRDLIERPRRHGSPSGEQQRPS